MHPAAALRQNRRLAWRAEPLGQVGGEEGHVAGDGDHVLAERERGCDPAQRPLDPGRIIRAVRDSHIVRPGARDAQRTVEQGEAAEHKLRLAAANPPALAAGQDHDPHAKMSL